MGAQGLGGGSIVLRTMCIKTTVLNMKNVILLLGRYQWITSMVVAGVAWIIDMFNQRNI